MNPITINVEVTLSEATLSVLQQLVAQGRPVTVQPSAPEPPKVMPVETRPAPVVITGPATLAKPVVVTQAQLREAIGSAQTEHGVSPAAIRALLESEYQVQTSNQLNDEQKAAFIDKLQGLWQK